MRDFSTTSLSVSAGHPDKLCDKISDAIVDAYLRLDPECRIEAECVVTSGIVFCACHSSSEAQVDIPAIARRVIADIGYTPATFGADEIPVMASLAPLPAPTATTATRAGQNVTTFGYATSHTTVSLPLPIYLAHRVVRCVSNAGDNFRLLPDAQAQVTVRYQARQPVRIDNITLLVTQQDPGSIGEEDFSRAVREQLIEYALTDTAVGLDDDTRILINPPGSAIPEGPKRHSGVTGRKLGVDLYGNFSRQPSSALCGKDPSRIDRSATYAARHAALNVVAAGLAQECEVQISYSLGDTGPLSVEVDTFDSGVLSDEEIGNRIRERFDFRPVTITRKFNLLGQLRDCEDGVFEQLAVYGQVGRQDLLLPWEQADHLDLLQD